MLVTKCCLIFIFGYVERDKTFNLHIYHERASDQLIMALLYKCLDVNLVKSLLNV